MSQKKNKDLSILSYLVLGQDDMAVLILIVVVLLRVADSVWELRHGFLLMRISTPKNHGHLPSKTSGRK